MGEGGYRVPGTKARKGAALVRVEQAGLPCQGGESENEDVLEDLRNSFAEDDYAEGGRGVVGRFAGFVHDNPVHLFDGGGVVPKHDQWRQEMEEEGGIQGVHLFPDRVLDPIGAWCGRGRGLGQSVSDFFLCEWDG